MAEANRPPLIRFFWGDGEFLTRSSFAAITAVLVIYTRDKHWTPIDFPSMIGFILLIMTSRLATDVSERGERICYLIFLVFICIVAYFWNLVLDHECTECLLGLPEILKKYLLPQQDGEKKRSPIIHLFAEEGKTPQKCASCFLHLASYFQLVKLIPQRVKGSIAVDTFEKIDDLAFLGDHIHQYAPSEYCTNEGSCPDVQDPKALSPTEFRILDEWYEKMRAETKPKNALKDLLMALAADIDSQEGKKFLADAAHDILCYPISRMNGPKPSEFIKNLEDPRWTGEENFPENRPMDIDFDKLVAIMRGDMMHSLPPDVCAMIRIASSLSVDETVLTHSMSAATIAPVANETMLKGEEHVSYLFPGLYIPKVDEDKDPKGSNPIGLLISIFKRLPIQDDNIAFETRQEYLAFFRWLLEHKIQDEFYFPAWLKGDKGIKEIGELVANQFQHSGDRQRIFDVTSDKTLATRAFFGAGMKTLTNIVLPGDPSYGYLVDPSYYNTQTERDFFKNEVMPTEEDLLNMAKVAWGKPVNDIKKLRDKVVQVDYTLASHWEYRDAYEQNGAILYLDAEKRMPMGIWVCAWKKLILPNSSDWEKAKFVYRGTEVVTAALMHVGEYHLGWAERFSVALRQTLPHSHGLRALMKPYTHGTGQVNYQAYQMLLMEDSILARADGFTNYGRSHSWGHWVKHTNLGATLPDLLAAKKLPPKLEKELVYFKQGKALWDMHYHYVDKFVDLVYGEGEAAAISKDDDLKRFWHHINSGGRRLCPCVCSMDSTMFFTKNKWPAFETTRTCEGLLNHSGFETEETNMVARREAWCKRMWPQERTKALYSWLESDCEKTDSCEAVWYKVEHMRHDMALPELTRQSLVNLMTRFIYEVTIGHEMAADNIPFIVDPYYGGVRRNKEYVFDKITKQPMVDVSTWVFGTVISCLTTIRSMPLLADWSDLLESWVDNESDWRKLSDADRAKRKKAVKDIHLEYKKALILNANNFLKESLKRHPNERSPFLNPAVQAGSIAV